MKQFFQFQYAALESQFMELQLLVCVYVFVLQKKPKYLTMV